MKCKNCGKEIAEDSVFCEFCGTKVAQYDNAILTILDNALTDEAPMKALKACKKCYNLCQNKHPYDYKEYINQIVREKYPQLQKRCNIDKQYIKMLISGTILFIIIIVIAMASSHGGSERLLGLCIVSPIFIILFWLIREK